MSRETCRSPGNRNGGECCRGSPTVVGCTDEFDELDEYEDNNYESTEDGNETNKILKFFGYNKVIKEETIKTKVKIIDKDYKESYTTMIFTGKVCIPVSHPPEYNVKYIKCCVISITCIIYYPNMAYNNKINYIKK